MAGVPCNREYPCTTVAIRIAIESAIGSQVSLLHNIFGIIGVPAQVSSQVIGCVQVRLEQLLKLLALSEQSGLSNDIAPA
jgi:hypothetical protein